GGALDEQVLETTFAPEEVLDRPAGPQPHEDVEIGEAEIGIEDEDLAAQARERDRKVRDDGALPDASFPAGHGEREPLDEGGVGLHGIEPQRSAATAAVGDGARHGEAARLPSGLEETDPPARAAATAGAGASRPVMPTV